MRMNLVEVLTLELGSAPSYPALGVPTPRDAYDSDDAPPAAKGTKRRGKRQKKTVKIGRVSGAVVQIGDGNVCTGVAGTAGAAGAAEQAEPAVIPPVAVAIPVLDIAEVDGNAIPALLELPAAYVKAEELVKAKQRQAEIPNADVQFYYDYISTALRHIAYSGRKLNCLWWIPELKEGWYDSSLWCHIIDALCAQSIYVTVLRKEIQIIPRDSTDRFDGVFRWMNGMNERFDLGVIEVGPMSQLPNSDPKPATDRAKILRGMALLLAEARKHKKDQRLQIVGVLCSGWSITLFRMWHSEKGPVVEDKKYTVWTMEEHVSKNFGVFRAVVQSLETLMQTADILTGAVDAVKESTTTK